MSTYLITNYNDTTVCPATIKVVQAESHRELVLKLEQAGYKDVKIKRGGVGFDILQTAGGYCYYKLTNATALGNEIQS